MPRRVATSTDSTPPARAEQGRVQPDLWGLVWGRPEVDPVALAEAIEHEAGSGELDYRTRQLIHEGADALERYWSDERWGAWLAGCPARERIEAIRREDFGPPGFHLTEGRLVPATDPEQVKMFLRDLGLQLPETTRLPIGGAIALILTGYLTRSTIDIDVVDEVPDAIRSRRQLLAELKRSYHLELTHFGSHYLPTGWSSRLRSLGRFGNIEVEVVDPYDVFLGKLFSKRTKDRDDLRTLKGSLDKTALIERLRGTTAALLGEPSLRENAERNWYILFGEPLPLSE